MTKLIIDQGNTFTKVALFEEGRLLKQGVLRVTQGVSEWVNQSADIILSSVGKDEELQSLLVGHNVLTLDAETAVPIENKYQSKKTLGNDRLAGVVAATLQFPEHHVLVIDAGTCITFDLINDKKEYLGGSIAPGLQMRLKALNNQTARLPLVELQNTTKLVGDDTDSSILSGVVNGTLAEIDGLISRYKEQYPNLQIIMTGGDANFFDKGLKNSIFADLNLVLKGLNEILRYNEANI